ncbi:MAG TPA: helix-turn-helix domain-containing protein [Draconibacterium sp.]|nr:helix-turn-helix domain-containing protein [Draconibacterium sp.]
MNTILKVILIISKLYAQNSLSFFFGHAGAILESYIFSPFMTDKFTYHRQLFPPPEEVITLRDMLILAFQIQNDMKTTKKLLQSIMEGPTPKNSTPNKNRNPTQNTVPSMNQKIMNSDWMTTKEVMQWLKLSKRTIQNYRNEGKIPFETFNGCIYYSKHEIKQCFEKYDVKNGNVK